MVVRRSYLRPGPGKIPASDPLRPRGAAKKALHCYRGQLPAAGSGRRWRRSGCRRRATYRLRADPSRGHLRTGAPYEGYLTATRRRPLLANFQKHGRHGLWPVGCDRRARHNAEPARPRAVYGRGTSLARAVSRCVMWGGYTLTLTILSLHLLPTVFWQLHTRPIRGQSLDAKHNAIVLSSRSRQSLPRVIVPESNARSAAAGPPR